MRLIWAIPEIMMYGRRYMYALTVIEQDESVYIQARESISASDGTTNSMTANTRCGYFVGVLNDAIFSKSWGNIRMSSPC